MQNEIELSELMGPSTIIFAIVALLCALGLLIIWIVTLVKQFKAGDTVWGVLTIFFTCITGTIWAFMNGRAGLGVWWILLTIGVIVSYIMALAPIMAKMMEAANQGTGGI